MHALIISDSHGRANDVMKAVELTKPDAVFHLGDGRNDCRGFGLLYSDIELFCVSGNCDFSGHLEASRIVNIEGVRIFMTHGHPFKVKLGLQPLVNYAKKYKADVVLYGHTHVRDHDIHDGMIVINPGSLGYSGTYGVLTIVNGEVSYESYML